MSMSFRRHLLPLLLLGLLAPAARSAFASCGADGCPLDVRGPETSLRRFSFDLAWLAIDQDHVWVGSREGFVGEIPAHENEISTRTRTLQATGRVRLTDQLAFSASLPWIDRVHRHEHALHPGHYVMEEFQMQGLGDATVLGAYTPGGAGPGRALSVTLQLGAKLPTGLRHVAPVNGDEPEPAARPGNGSFDLIAGAQVRHSFAVTGLAGLHGSLPLSLGVLTRANGSGTEGYTMGNETQINATAAYPLTHWLQVLGQVNARWRQQDGPGLTHADPAHTGGNSILASPGLLVRVGNVAWYAYDQIRVHEHVNGIQIVAPHHLMIGSSWSLGD
jgi:hypothetical protein